MFSFFVLVFNHSLSFFFVSIVRVRSIELLICREEEPARVRRLWCSPLDFDWLNVNFKLSSGRKYLVN